LPAPAEQSSAAPLGRHVSEPVFLRDYAHLPASVTYSDRLFRPITNFDRFGAGTCRSHLATTRRPPRHIFVIVKVPDPVHAPLKFQLPAIVLLFTVPVSTSVFPGGVPDTIVNWNAPVILPFIPLSTNDPVCVPPEVKQLFEVVKLRFVPVTTVVVLPCVSDVLNVKAGVVSAFVSVAVQLPVIVPAVLEFPPPQAESSRPNPRTIAIPNCFIDTPLTPLFQPTTPAKVAPAKTRKQNEIDPR
jgi:hypothetical protein